MNALKNEPTQGETAVVSADRFAANGLLRIPSARPGPSPFPRLATMLSMARRWLRRGHQDSQLDHVAGST
jgi:hypothetical protein